MAHLSSLKIVHYRGLDGLEIPRFASRVNILTGANGIGKTSLAEAAWLFNGRHNPILAWNVHVRRRAGLPTDPIAALSDGGFVELRGREQNGERGVPEVEYASKLAFDPFTTGQGVQTPNGPGSGEPRLSEVAGVYGNVPLPLLGRLRVWHDGEEPPAVAAPLYQQVDRGFVMYPDVGRPPGRPSAVIETAMQPPQLERETIQHFSNVVRAGEKGTVIERLQLLRPEIDDLEVLTDEQNEPYMSAVLADGARRSMVDLGAGIVRVFRMVVKCFVARDGMLILDEIENGYHHSVLPDLWERLLVLADSLNVQVVATTHSKECLDAAVAAFGEDRFDDVAVHSLFRVNGKGPVRSQCFTGEALEGARHLNLEMR